jgi:hypothetical protein
MQWGIVKCCRVVVCGLSPRSPALFIISAGRRELYRIGGRRGSGLSAVVHVHYYVCCLSCSARDVADDRLNCSLVLYMIYYPPHLKYAQIEIDTQDSRPVQHYVIPIRSDDWRLSITLSSVVAIHLFVFPALVLLLPNHFCA